MRKLLLLIALYLGVSFPLVAQFNDDFSDGDYVINPAWYGDNAKFEVDINSELHLNAPSVSDEAYLSTTSEAIADAEWRFVVEISENPSSSNFTSIYLISDQADLSGSLKGYFVKVGGSSDEISLYRQDGTSESKIIDGLDDRVNTKPVQVEIKVTRDLAGNWTLYSKTFTEVDFTAEGNTFDDTHTLGSYFGVYCKYTSTRSDAFFFDNFVVTGTPVPDLSPPGIASVKVSDEQNILLTFTEPLAPAGAENVENYLLGTQQPSSALYANDTVGLFYDTPLSNGITQYLSVSGLEDLKGNTMVDTTLNVIYFEPKAPTWQSILINEFLADPTPAKLDLPDQSDAEFIELYNADDGPFNLKDWQINGHLLPDFILLPGEYVILCRQNYKEDFSNYGQVLIPDTWPSLTNSGTTITLRSADNILIDTLDYNSTLVGEGVSTERIYAISPCGIPSNYGLSIHQNGASPGEINSIFSDEKDTQAPVLQSINPLSYDSLLFTFDEKALPGQDWTSSIRLNEKIFPTKAFYNSPDSTGILLIYDEILPGNLWYDVRITDISDCEGNTIDSSETHFYLDLTPPHITNIIIRDTAAVEVRFSEQLEKSGAEKESNYLLQPLDVLPRKALLNDDSLGVILEFSQSLVGDMSYVLQASTLEDSLGNTVLENQPTVFQFNYTNDVDSLKIINAYQIGIYLSAEAKLEGIANDQFEVDRSVGSPVRVLKDQENPHLLNLIFSQSLQENRNHILSIDGVKNTDGVLLSTPIQRFFYDTDGPEIQNAFAEHSQELSLQFDEKIYESGKEISLWINNEMVEIAQYSLAEQSITFSLIHPLEAETNLSIGIGGITDAQKNLSHPEKEFNFYFDLLAPQLDTAYFFSGTEIMLEFHEPLLPSTADASEFIEIITSEIQLEKLRFLKLQNNKVILGISLGSNIQNIDFHLFNISDLKHNIISDTLTLSLQNTAPSLSQVYPLSAHQLSVHFSREISQPVMTDFQLSQGGLPDSISVVSEGEYILHFAEPFRKHLNYTLSYHEQTLHFTYREYLRALQQTGPASLGLYWDTQLDQPIAEQLANYFLNGMTNPIAAVYLPEEQMVQLLFEKPFEQDVLHTLIIANLVDIDHFRIPDSEHLFGQILEPQEYELIITEVMADPSPSQSLPEFEYVELLNISDRPLQLEGLSLHDKNQSEELQYHWLLPGEYVILCDEDAYPAMTAYGIAMGLRSFPNLNAEEDHLRLVNTQGSLVHSLAYDNTWYNDAYKNDGGWSLEMVDTQFPCRQKNNWAASTNDNGGTPGIANSVQASNPDQRPPVLLKAVATDEAYFRLDFDEKLSSEFSEQFALFLNESLVADYGLNPDLKSLHAKSPTFLQAGVTYQVSIQYISDCSGNTDVNEQNTSLILAEEHQEDDILISEIMFQPRSGGVEFVELYNNSDRHISLKNWKISLRKSGGDEEYVITEDVLMLPPSSYLALTSDQITLIADYPKASQANIFEMKKFPNLSSEGNNLLLLDNYDEIMQQLTFTPDWHHPLLQDTRGVSLERISWEAEVDDSQAWQSAASTAGFATPGYTNSQWQQRKSMEAALSVEPRIFFPDQSGFQDYTRIMIRSDRAGSVTNIKIFDMRGRLIRTLAQNQTLAGVNEIVWDGTDQQRKRAKDGHYLIWAETFDLRGNVRVNKTKVVVGSRY